MPTLAVFVKSCLIASIFALFSGGVVLYSGIYPIGADVPHNKLTFWLLETLRERSIARSAEDLHIPEDLNSAERLLSGGADYNDMCADCHLKPGKTESDFSIGLYPSPPNLSAITTNNGNAIKRQFWIIKHGIKASGMPAWGYTHDDERIWNMVAFLQRLSTLTPEQYQILTARGDSAGMHHH